MREGADVLMFMSERAKKRTAPRSATILCVDDNPGDLYTMELTLRGAGHSVTVASHVADALLLLKAFHFDMLLLDCVPGFTCLTVEAKRTHPDLRIVVCADDSRDSRLTCVDAVVQKPLPAVVFLHRIAELLAA